MNDASDPRSVPTTTCPNCGTVQPQARRCQDCGAPLPWSRPVLKGRERALGAAGRGRARWPVWVAGGSVVLLVGALAAVYLGLYPLQEPSAAALAAEAAGTDPELQRLLSEDPKALAQARTVLDDARELGLSQQESMFRVRGLLRELQAARAQAVAARVGQDPDRTTAPTPTPTPTPDAIEDTGTAPDTANSVPLGAVGAVVGIQSLPTRKCFGAGEDMECIEQFDDPAALSAAGGTDTGSALKNAETLRRKTQESAEILTGL